MKNKLYQYFNFVENKCGEPFALCPAHEHTLVKSPPNCILNVLAEKSNVECNRCWAIGYKRKLKL